jgi:hypothetical protein
MRLWLLVLVSCATLPFSLRADAGPEEEARDAALSELRTPGKGRGEWKGALDSLEGDPEGLRLVLSQILDPEDEALKARKPSQRNPLLKFVMNYLLTREADGDQILLARAMMNRLAALDDHELAELVFRELTKDQTSRTRPAWERFMMYAEGVLLREDHGATTPTEAAQAIWLLSSVRTPRSARAVRVLFEFAKRPEQDLLGAIDEEVWIKAFVRLLGHAFESRRGAIEFLEDQKTILQQIASARHSPDLYELLFQLHDAADTLGTPDRGNAIEDALGIVAAAKTAAEIEKYTDPERRPYTEVRLAAWRRVRDLEPKAEADWIALLVAGLQREREQTVLSALLDVLGMAAFAKAEDTGALATAIVARLDGEGFVRADRLANRERLVSSLVGVGRIAHFREVLDVARAHAKIGADHLKLYEGLIQKVGEVQGVTVAAVAPHYFADDKTDQPEQIRRAVAEVLGRRKIREDQEQSQVASALLRLLLGGENGTPRDPVLAGLAIPAEKIAPEARGPVRRALMESLSRFPSEANAQLLESLARRAGKKDDAWAEERVHAVELLGKLLQTKNAATDGAARVLIRYVEESLANPDRATALKIEAIKGLGGLHAGAGEQLASDVRKAVRAAISANGEQGEGGARDAAVAAAIRLEDPLALDAILTQVRDSGHEQAWADRLRAFVVALSKIEVVDGGERGKHDAALSAFLRKLAASAGEGDSAAKDWSWALGIASELAPADSTRLAFVELSADLHAQRVDKPNGLSKEARQALGKVAYAHYISLGTQLAGREGQDERRKQAFEKAYDMAVKLAGEMELGGPAWLDALSAAAKSRDTTLADRALADDGAAKRLLEIKATLTAEQLALGKNLTSQLENLPRGS